MSKNINKFLAAVFLLVPLVLAGCATDTIRVASHARLTNIDPVSTTAYVARTHGYLVYDTLFAMDEGFVPRPQMVDTWEVSDDGKTWTFTLRDGLKWHDGSDVTAADCVASLKRWGRQDGMGQQLFSNITGLEAENDKTFVMTLSEPSSIVLHSLAKISVNVPFMMPKEVAATAPDYQIEDATGSGPFIYDEDGKLPNKAVYIRNPNYVPRSEESSLAAGGKVAEVSRLEFIHYPDQEKAVQALIAGEVDYVESPSTRLISRLEGNNDIIVASTDPLGNIAMARFNHQQPPFDNADVRRAVLMAMEQEEYMTAAFNDRRFWRNCYSVYPCGTKFASQTGSEVMQTSNTAAAKKALQEAGYDGAPVVLLHPTDTPVMSALTQVTADLLREIGMNVEVQDMDWATLLERRQNRGPVSENGWSMFHSWWIASDVASPLSIAFSGDPKTGWVGWARDAQLEQLRSEFARAKSQEEQQEIAARVQERLWAIGAFGVLGQFYEPVAYRSNLNGITSPIQFFWGLSKE